MVPEVHSTDVMDTLGVPRGIRVRTSHAPHRLTPYRPGFGGWVKAGESEFVL